MKLKALDLPLALRVPAAALAVFLLTQFAGEALARGFLPIIHWVYALLDSDHRIVELVLSNETALKQSDWVYSLKVAPRSMVWVNGQAIATDPRGWAKVSVLTSYLWHPLMMAAVTMAAFKASTQMTHLYRLLCLLPLLALIALLDIPGVMWAEVWQNYASFMPEGTTSPLLLWSDFLHRGGRFLLGALAGVLAVRLAETLTQRRGALASD